jgi:hypothetical protein
VSQPRVWGIGLALALHLLSTQTPGAPLRFAWPVPAQALVTVDAAKAGRTVRSSLALKVSRDDRGNIRLDFSDARLLAVDSRVLAPGLEPSLGPLAAAMPSLLIGQDGRVREVLGLGHLAEALVADSPEAKRDALRLALASPRVQAEFEARATEDWNLWVGIWLGREVPAGGRLVLSSKVDALGTQVEAHGFIADLGSEKGLPGAARKFRLELTADGPDFAKALFDELAGVARVSGRPLGDLSPERIETASRRQFVEAVMDPGTLRPYRVETGTESVFKLRGEPAQSDAETKSFRFEWR